MAVMSSDGVRHHSASRALLHEERMGSGKEKPAAMAPMAGAKDVSSMPIADVVAKHGPATEVHMKHDHAAGMHHVTSHHKGHIHKSKHSSAEEAHEHAQQASGVGMGDEEEPDNTKGSSYTPDDEDEEGTGGGIPGLE